MNAAASRRVPTPQYAKFTPRPIGPGLRSRSRSRPRTQSRSLGTYRAALATLVAVLLLSLAAPEADAGSRVRPYREGRPIGLDTDLLSKSGLSAWAIDEYLAANTPLPKLGTAFLAAERKYGINARFLLAAAMHESNRGRSSLSRAKYNLFGYNAYDRDPYRYATAFEGYAKGIDRVARFMKESYLTRSGRWWGGAPTLRSMQRFWSSSGRWGENVSRIATALKLDSLRKRDVRFRAPVLPDLVRTRDALSVRLAWRGGRVPDGITFRATWTPVGGQDDPLAVESATTSPAQGRDTAPAALEPTALESAVLGGHPLAVVPGSVAPDRRSVGQAAPEPFTVKAKRTKLGRDSARLQVEAPAQPGEYVLLLSLRDRDGASLPRSDKRSIPAVRVRVAGDWAVRYAIEQVGESGVLITVTNAGHETIPVSPLPADVAGRLGQVDARDTKLVLRAFRPGDPTGFDLAAIALTERLGPGDSVSLRVTDLGSIAPGPTLYLVPALIVFDDPMRFDGTRATGFWFRSGGTWEAGSGPGS